MDFSKDRKPEHGVPVICFLPFASELFKQQIAGYDKKRKRFAPFNEDENIDSIFHPTDYYPPKYITHWKYLSKTPIDVSIKKDNVCGFMQPPA